VPESLDLRPEHRQVRLLGLALRLFRHRRDHLREHVEELFFELDEMAIDHDPATSLRQRVRQRVFTT
jgi:hypothetical protein